MAEPKGMSLEREFAEWMKKRLGYTKTKLRQPVKGKVAARSYEVDVHAEKYSLVWDYTMRAGLVVLGFAVLATVLGSREAEALAEGIVRKFNPSLAGSGLLTLGLLGVAAGVVGRHFARVHAWVECKDHKSNVKREHVVKLAAAVHDVRELEEAAWQPSVVILVAGKDFDADALNFAREHGIKCYRRSESGFEPVS